MALECGKSVRGQRTVIYKNFEYVKDRENVCGTVAWRCKYKNKFQCKARIVTDESRIVAEKQPEHTHSGNIATSKGRKAVGEMKDMMGALMATPSSSQASVSATLDDNVLMALPKRSLLTRTLQRKRQKIMKEANNGQALPAVPSDLSFAIPDQFREMVLYDSGPGDD